MFIVINHWLKAVKHIQNQNIGDVDVTMLGDFYETPPIKEYWIFESLNDNINVLT
jgi:hypothetical protein